MKETSRSHDALQIINLAKNHRSIVNVDARIISVFSNAKICSMGK